MIVAPHPNHAELVGIDSQRSVLKLLRTHPVWADTPEPNRRALAATGRRLDLAPGQVAVREGQESGWVHLLVEGVLRAHYPGTRSRRSLTARLMGAPEVFGDLACLQGSVYGSSVEALTHAVIISFPAKQYFAELLRDPATCMRQYRDLGRRFKAATQHELSTATGGSTERVGALILAYAEHFGRPTPEGLLVDLPLSQESIAEQTGCNRRTVVRVLDQYFVSGVLRRRGRRLMLLKEAELRASLMPTWPEPPRSEPRPVANQS